MMVMVVLLISTPHRRPTAQDRPVGIYPHHLITGIVVARTRSAPHRGWDIADPIHPRGTGTARLYTAMVANAADVEVV